MTRFELQPALTIGAWSVRAIVRRRRSIIDTPAGYAANLSIKPHAILIGQDEALQVLSLDGASLPLAEAKARFAPALDDLKTGTA